MRKTADAESAKRGSGSEPREHPTSKRGARRAQKRPDAVHLEHARKLEAIGTLAGGVAHDFNNVLMGISSCTSIALSTLAADSPARLFLEEVKASAETGAAIARQLLTFCRAHDPKPAVFELNAVLSSTRSLLERLLGEEIELSTRLRAPDSRVRSDPGQMEQVIINLAVNAGDAMPQGGRLVLETRNLTLAASNRHLLPAGDYVVLTVTDNGVGIDAVVLDRIFEPFFTTKEVGKGTGLGLSTVHGIVKSAGGAVEVRSQPHRGTTFDILLPLATEATTTNTPSFHEERGRKQGTILVVEDHRAVRMGIRYFLEEAGYRVLEAGSGPEALECCRRYPGPIDVLLTDVVLPGLSGPDLALEVNQLKPGIAVIYTSAYPEAWLVSQGRIEAGTRSLQKPFGAEELQGWVEQALSRSVRRPALPGTVLLVEDESASRLAISEYLREFGWTVLAAEDAAQALFHFRARKDDIDAIITDYSLPEMTGVDLVREIRSLRPGIPVAYMSGYSDLELDPPGPLLVKPIDLQAISHTLGSLCTKDAAQAAARETTTPKLQSPNEEYG